MHKRQEHVSLESKLGKLLLKINFPKVWLIYVYKLLKQNIKDEDKNSKQIHVNVCM